MLLARAPFTTRTLMVATLIVGGALALVLSAAERGSFRLAASHHSTKALPGFGGDWDRSWLGYHYHTLVSRMLDYIADLRGEPDCTDPFPGVTFDEIVKLLNESPSCGFRLIHQLEEAESSSNPE